MTRHKIMLLLVLTWSTAIGQTETAESFSKFPVLISLQFHSLAMPFRDLKSNFANVGISVGTEVNYNRSATLVQQLTIGWYRNRVVGNGILVISQAGWRPTTHDAFAETRIGVGYQLSFRPVESYELVNGQWRSAGHQGKGMFTIPISLGVGFSTQLENSVVAPFVAYNFLIASGYNKTIPLIPETLIQVGSRIHINK